ncbi:MULTISPECIES: phosphoglycerate dehydrogenase [Tissierellales]|jgi:D-3-phosphoglycerate dehydrogenase|uniref:Hydroxyacid dehydrogenase n=1 Tax=Acidilutibacter cellobiosedens TaxID=2507161 RepID=A0A410QFV2_9FIRM|nr:MULTISPECIES: phosphoglycerate dehydrogenase [Tissierellales]MBE6083106.1 hydroxyacid dehydrogenase [Tissierellaceae bacterium]QAT62806.1 hydroxyacid dehydrogenase [Acidilutibacter cellobiosedens]SCL93263.1 putative 2-hydroxyacid dehydrogenase [Sporanaerobacter sp. PP17-6a]
MSKYKVVVTARSFGKSSTEPFDILEKNGCEVHKIPIEKPLNAKELIPLIKDADALIAGNDKVTKEVIDAGNKLKVISRYGIGYDNVDIKAAKEKGIVVTNTPNTNNNSVADLTIGLMIAIARNIVGANNTVKSEGWGRVLGTEVYKKTIGVIGTGSIGKGVIKRAKGFEMDVLCFDVYPDHEFAEKYGAKYCSMEEILQKSDIITIHVPLMESTKNLIGEKELKMMKNTAFLINAARGGIVNEDALYNALSKNIIAGAALDAVEHEPPVGSPLLKLDNVIITPHIGGYTSTAVNNMGVAAANNVVFVLNNEPGAHIVNN